MKRKRTYRERNAKQQKKSSNKERKEEKSVSGIDYLILSCGKLSSLVDSIFTIVNREYWPVFPKFDEMGHHIPRGFTMSKKCFVFRISKDLENEKLIQMQEGKNFTESQSAAVRAITLDDYNHWIEVEQNKDSPSEKPWVILTLPSTAFKLDSIFFQIQEVTVIHFNGNLHHTLEWLEAKKGDSSRVPTKLCVSLVVTEPNFWVSTACHFLTPVMWLKLKKFKNIRWSFIVACYERVTDESLLLMENCLTEKERSRIQSAEYDFVGDLRDVMSLFREDRKNVLNKKRSMEVCRSIFFPSHLSIIE
jgi:hypothetical protein